MPRIGPGPRELLCEGMRARFPVQPPPAKDWLQRHDRAELKDSTPLPDLRGPRAAALALGRRRRKTRWAVPIDGVK
jgi:hypothetical protein